MAILSVLTEAMESEGIRPILVGGKAMELYTQGNYLTYDTDLVLSGRETAHAILSELGFRKRQGQRHWYHEELEYAIEIPDDQLAGSMDRVNRIELDGYQVTVIGFEDLIADRMRACKFWTSSRDCEQAENLLTVHYRDIDFTYLSEQAERDGVQDLLAELIERAKQNRRQLELDE
jgi:predicted nucleotidyltransferase